MENLKNFIQEEVKKLHKISLLEDARKIIKEELESLNNKILLTFLRVDENTGNFIYKGSDGNIYIDIEGVIHDVTKQREPIGPVYNTIIKTGEPVYNPEDRFARNPGSKIKTETKDVKAMYRKAGMEPPHPGKGIHTKKFHKCVTSVGDESGKNPYAICMDSLGKEKAVKAPHRTDEEIVDEVKTPAAPISEKTKAVLNKWIQENGTKETAVKLINKLSATGIVSDLPDSIEYGQGINKIEALLSKGNLDQAFHFAKSLANKLEKKAIKDMFS